MRTMIVAGILLAVPLMAQERPPNLLLIFRDSPKRGSEAAFKKVEEEAARICAELKFPNPHFAMESLAGPKEVWWLNNFESEADKQRVTDEYSNNRALVEALEGIGKRRESLVGTPVEVLVSYRPDLSRASWKIAGARFFVVTVTRQDPHVDGSAFEAPDGTRFILRPAATQQEADALASAAGSETTVFAIRPYWGMPAKEWIAADPEFWKSSPMAKVGQREPAR